jgi:hypothetical protein
MRGTLTFSNYKTYAHNKDCYSSIKQSIVANFKCICPLFAKNYVCIVVSEADLCGAFFPGLTDFPPYSANLTSLSLPFLQNDVVRAPEPSSDGWKS